MRGCDREGGCSDREFGDGVAHPVHGHFAPTAWGTLHCERSLAVRHWKGENMRLKMMTAGVLGVTIAGMAYGETEYGDSWPVPNYLCEIAI